MAGPAQLFRPDNDEDKVYDHDSGRPSIKPNLTLGGSDVAGGNGINAKRAAAEGKYGKYASGLKGKERDGEKGPGSLAGTASAGGAAGKALASATPQGRALNAIKEGLASFWKSKQGRRKSLLGGGAAAGITALLIFIFGGLGSQELIQVMANLENHFFAHVQGDIDKEGQKMISSYIQNRIIDRLGAGCLTSAELAKCIDKHKVPSDPANPVDNTFDNWDKADLAGAMADEGVTIEKKGGRVLMHVLTDDGKTITTDITAFAARRGVNLFDTKLATSSAIRFGQALRATYTHIVTPAGSFLYNRYTAFMAKRGITFCVVLCKPNEDHTSTTDDATAKEAELANEEERVVKPTAKALLQDGLACLISQCKAAERPKADPNTSSDLDGPVPENEFNKGVEATVAEATSATASGVDLKTAGKEAEAAVADKSEDSFIKVAIKAVTGGATDVASIFLKSLSTYLKIAGSGWLLIAQLFAQVIIFMSHASLTLKAMTYTIAAVPKIAIFNMFGSAADEQKHGGHDDLRQTGSFTTSIQGGSKGPAYGYYADPNHNTNSAAAVHAYLVGHKMAQNGYSSGLINLSAEFNKIPGIGALVAIAKTFNTIVNTALGPLNTVISHIPGVQALTNKIVGLGMPLLKFIILHLVRLPDLTHLSNEDRMNMILVGGNLSANEAGKKIGQQRLTPKQAADLTNQELQQQQHDFQQLPLFARLFSFNTPYSLASRMAIALPLNFGTTLGTASQTLSVNLLSSPFSKFFGSFATLFRGSFVHAAVAPAEDPAGVAQYGRLTTDPVYNADPAAYWKDNKCADQKAKGYPAWEKKRVQDKDTGQWEYTTPNDCLFIEETSAALCQIPGTNQATNDTCPKSGQAAASPTAPTGSPAGATIDMSAIFKSSVNIACAASTKDLGIQDGYHGGKLIKIRICAIPGFPSTGGESNNQYGVTGAGGNVVVNSVASGAVLAMVQAAKTDGVNLTAISSFRTMAHQQSLCPCDGVHVAHPGYSNHQMGLAIDFGGGLPSTPGPIPGNKFWDWLSKNASKFGYKNYPVEAWHWSPTGT